MMNLPTHSTPKAPSAAIMTINVWIECELTWLLAKLSPKSADQVEKPSPMNASVQKGTTSFHRCDLPVLPQAHVRLR
jgi:hypothetical protein